MKVLVVTRPEAIARADEITHETARRLDREGVEVSGTAGESEPVGAIEDALVEFPADQVLVPTHQDAERQRYREDLDREAVRRRLEIPAGFESLDRPEN